MSSIEATNLDTNKKERIIYDTGEAEYNSNESDVDVEHDIHPSNSFDFTPALHSENPTYCTTPLNCRDANNKFFDEVLEIFDNEILRWGINIIITGTSESINFLLKIRKLRNISACLHRREKARIFASKAVLKPKNENFFHDFASGVCSFNTS